jgi:hypothetical protein
MYWQPFTNMNGTVNSNVSTSPLAFYVEANVVIIEIGCELIVPWLFCKSRKCRYSPGIVNKGTFIVYSPSPPDNAAGILHIITDCNCFRASPESRPSLF